MGLFAMVGAAGPDCEEQEARRIVTEAAVAHLESTRERSVDSDADFGEIPDEVFEDLMHHYRERLASLQSDGDDEAHAVGHRRLNELARSAARVERETAVRLRNQGRINDHVLRRIERELDLTESRLEAIAED